MLPPGGLREPPRGPLHPKILLLRFLRPLEDFTEEPVNVLQILLLGYPKNAINVFLKPKINQLVKPNN